MQFCYGWRFEPVSAKLSVRLKSTQTRYLHTIHYNARIKQFWPIILVLVIPMGALKPRQLANDLNTTESNTQDSFNSWNTHMASIAKRGCSHGYELPSQGLLRSPQQPLVAASRQVT